ncbi:SIR2 family protein [Sulfurovum sp. ST-21]|uniref:SIR2 family protein n=1 Tax=Sulfurovum indicum TaxID=2779528 RepID=A0A7M1S6Q3_9BACT|nr:SIR2 family protein [Sulfurovum indicum]QOR62040.1 SIR2 family protein [Sulfurovum indicum]
MTKKAESWCDRDEHHLFELYEDFNEWLEGDEGLAVREANYIDGLSQPSKAFYASDKEAYEQALERYRQERYHEVLSKEYIAEHFSDEHWYEKNVSRFDQLVDRIASGDVVPFIGAGLSVAGGFSTWEGHLRQQGRTAGIDAEHIEGLLSSGQYETVIEEIEESRGREVFAQEIRDVFGKTGELTQVTLLISELFTDTLLTTNYDKLIEQAYDTGANNLQIISGRNATEEPKADHVTVVKLHGDVDDQTTCILSKNQYDEAYGNEHINMHLPIPKLLEYYYKNSSLLFLGSSLNSDRTVQVFRTIKESLGDVEIPPHFSIEAAPETEKELVERNAYLVNLGIAPIWFEKGRYEYIENILRLARNEVRYRGIGESEVEEIVETKKPCKLDIELSEFLHDLIDLMPLMHWLHRHVPQKETAKYLQSMQRVFYADSFFIDNVDENLRIGVENLTRALSNKPKFDGYTHEKLLVAFKSFQKYFQSIGIQPYPTDGTEWNIHELFTIPYTQFDSSELTASNPNHHLSRLAMILLEHGRNQKHSPKNYCELPSSLNVEISDYLTVILKEKLGIEIPDRIQNGHIDEIRELCKSAWDHQEELHYVGFLQRVMRCFSKT